MQYHLSARTRIYSATVLVLVVGVSLATLSVWCLRQMSVGGRVSVFVCVLKNQLPHHHMTNFQRTWTAPIQTARMLINSGLNL